MNTTKISFQKKYCNMLRSMNNHINNSVGDLIGGGRNETIDCLKCYLIFLVIFGHVLYLTDSVYNDRLTKAFISWIWFFHMPAFTLASGFCFNNTQTLKKILISSAKILATYSVMQVSLSVIYGPFEWFSLLFIPQYAMWYLPALMIWRLLAHFCLKITNSLLVLLFVSSIIGLVVGFIPFSYLGFQRTFSFMPFFFMGMIFRRYNLIPIIRRYRRTGVTILVILLIIFLVPNRAICSGMCCIPYKDFYQIISRSSVLFLGTIMSLSFISSIPNNKMVASIGRHTLFVYCWHVFLVFHIIPKLWSLLSITPYFIVALFYSMLVFVVLVLLKDNKVLNFIINPIGKITSK